MARARGALLVGSVAFAVVLVLASSAVGTAARPVIWFTPDAGSPDMLALFTEAEQWADARAHLSVFKFYQGHVLDDPAPPSYFLPNTYQNLVGVGAFEKLTRQWRKHIAIEAAAVKPFLCTADHSGMRTSILMTLRSIANVQKAGGQVNEIAMDAPFGSGVMTPECGGPDPAPTVARLGQYMRIVHLVEPRVAIGLIEPYPFFPAAQLEQFLRLMVDNGIKPAFFHLDFDLNALQHNGNYAGYDAAGDMRRLDGLCRAMGIRFGFLFWGLNGQSDPIYYGQVIEKIRVVKNAFGPWEDLPDDLVFQSFAESNGLKTVPLNLPETAPFSHTHLIDEGWRMLHGFSPTGTARPRR